MADPKPGASNLFGSTTPGYKETARFFVALLGRSRNFEGPGLASGLSAPRWAPRLHEPWALACQWAFLSAVLRMSADAVAALADAVRPATAGPDLALADLATRWSGATSGNRGPGRRDGVDQAGRTSACACGRTEAPGLASQPGVLREGTDAVLDLGHAPVHPLLPRRPRMDPPYQRARRAGEQAGAGRRQPTRAHRSPPRSRRRGAQSPNLAPTPSTGRRGRRRISRASRGGRTARLGQDRY